jgi:hypothetical protein
MEGLDAELVALVAVLGDRAMRPIMARVCTKWRRATRMLAPGMPGATLRAQEEARRARGRPCPRPSYGFAMRFCPCYACALAERGWLGVLRWACMTQDLPPCNWAPIHAAASGDEATLMWCRERVQRCVDMEAWVSAALHGRRALLDAPNRHWNMWRAHMACAAAACGGHLDVVRYVHAKACACIADDRGAGDGVNDVAPSERASGRPVQCSVCVDCVWIEAARGGHDHILEWMPEGSRAHLTAYVFRESAAEAPLGALRLLRSRGCPWDALGFAAAAKGGRLDVLEWLHANGCPWNEAACAAAAESGRVDVLAWLRERGCPWNAAVCLNAAVHDHLDILTWARSHGCPWDRGACEAAAARGHLSVIAWAAQNGCPFRVGTVALAAATHGHLDVLEWVADRGDPCEWPLIVNNAVMYGQGRVLEWFEARFGRSVVANAQYDT